jgi:predicted ester cyclase
VVSGIGAPLGSRQRSSAVTFARAGTALAKRDGLWDGGGVVQGDGTKHGSGWWWRVVAPACRRGAQTRGCGMSSTAEMRELVRRFERALNEDKLDDLDDIMADDFVRHCEATPDLVIQSRDDFKEFQRGFTVGFPDDVQTITHIVAEGDEIGILATYEGTHLGVFGPFQPTGKRVCFTFAGVMRVADGKIAELWVTWDNMTVLGQLGVLPAPAGA